MKPSELMLKGYAMAGGRQCFGELCQGDPKAPTAVCAEGAINLAETGDARKFFRAALTACNVFRSATWCEIAAANDGLCEGQTDPMRIEDIAGILAAEGY